jgi:hypothetical protein
VKRILKYVFERKRAYNKLPLFEWMRDETLSARQRLAFYPAMAPFILSFGDLNKFVLRKEANGDHFQEMVNQHTLEDDHHWPWYLEDFSKLGFDDAARGTHWMRFLWGEETAKNRVLMAKLTALIEPASGLERLAIVEAIEETGNVLFSTMLPLAEAIEKEIGQELRYCGAHHFGLESGHTVGADHRILAETLITDEDVPRYRAMVDLVYEVFEEWTHELLRYAKAHPVSAEMQSPAAPEVVPGVVAPGTGTSGVWALEVPATEARAS